MTAQEWVALKPGDRLISRLNPALDLVVTAVNPLILKAPHCEFEVNPLRRKDFDVGGQENLPF